MQQLQLYGCFVQANPEEAIKIPEIDLCLGNSEKNNIVFFVEKSLNEKNKKIVKADVFEKQDYCEFGNVTYSENTRAVIKVQDGCDRFCSYCLIPYARGRVRSRNSENVINEIKDLALNGYKEVIITGIHVASYGKDFDKNYKLIDLLEEINEINGIERIRLRFN